MSKDHESPIARAPHVATSSRVPPEVWVLLAAAQLLAAFLIALPFTRGFRRLAPHERGVYYAGLIAAINGAALLATPLMQPWVARLLGRRTTCGGHIRRGALVGRAALALAVMLTTDVAMNAIGGDAFGIIAALTTAWFIWMSETTLFAGAEP